VLAGQGEHRFHDQWVKLAAGSLIRIPAGVRHALRNTGDGELECVISFSSGKRETVFLD
jgi:quercetin dioxygenase-like cupin family protein